MTTAAAGPDPRPLTDDERVQWRAFLVWTEHVTGAVGRALAAHGVSVAEYQVLARLGDAPDGLDGLDQGVLQGALDWSPSRLSHQLRRMEARGLVRGADVRPGQVRHVVLTAQGRRALDEVLPVHARAVLEAFVAPTSDALRAEVLRLAAGAGEP